MMNCHLRDTIIWEKSARFQTKAEPKEAKT